MNMKRKLLVIALVLISTGSVLTAKPQYSNLTGNRCIACHTNPQGSGLRNPLGSYSRNQSSIFNLTDTGIGNFLKEMGSYNSFEDEMIVWGLDYRLQSAKIGPDERKLFGMQIAPYLSIKPFSWLWLQGSYNIVEPLYEAQKSFTVSVSIKPSFEIGRAHV